MANRPDLNSLSAADRQELVGLMLQYLTDAIVNAHLTINHAGVNLFDGHRAYIAGMEAFLSANGGGRFVPLPKWNPTNPIPAEFNVVKPRDDSTPRPALVNLNPNRPLPAQFAMPAVCDFESGEALGNAINGWHGSVHIAVGGTMGNASIASAAPIFWCWHAFLDDVYWDYQRCLVACPRLTGISLPLARLRLRLVGLRVGTVTRIPRFIVRPDIAEMPPRIPLQPALDFDGRPLPIPPQLPNLLRGPLVLRQSPVAGTTVRLGSAVNLVVLDRVRFDIDDSDLIRPLRPLEIADIVELDTGNGNGNVTATAELESVMSMIGDSVN